MRFTPNYTVSYHGRFYRSGETFEINASDAAEMRKHGTVEEVQTDDTETVSEPVPPRRGRPKKAADS